MEAITIREALPSYTLYKKGKITKSRRLVWQKDEKGRLFVRRECCRKITDVTKYDIVHVEIAGEIIGYSMNCIHCDRCRYATHFVLDRWKPPTAMIETAFRYARKVIGDDLRYAIGGLAYRGAGKEWVHLYMKNGIPISVLWKDGGFIPVYNRNGMSYETLAEALAAGVESYRSHVTK